MARGGRDLRAPGSRREADACSTLLCLARIDSTLAADVARGLGMPAPDDAVDAATDPTPSPALSQVGGRWPVEGRTVGIIVDATADQPGVTELVDALAGHGLVPLLVAPTGGPIWTGTRRRSVCSGHPRTPSRCASSRTLRASWSVTSRRS